MGLFDIPPVEEQVDSALVAVFREIWKEREHRSEVSGTPLEYNFNPGMFFVFSHLRSRGSCPSLALEKDNIWLMTLSEHTYWEHHKEDIRARVAKGQILHWKDCLKAYDRLKPICNQIKK